MNIFVYGSLMFDEVWSRVVKGNYDSRHAILHGWRRLSIKDREYPAAVPSKGFIKGVVWLNISDDDLECLDKFEGFEYRRVSCRVETVAVKKLDAYIFRYKEVYFHLLLDHEWDKNTFENEGLKRFLNSYYGFENVMRN